MPRACWSWLSKFLFMFALCAAPLAQAQAQTPPKYFVEAEAGRGNGVIAYSLAAGMASDWKPSLGPIDFSLTWQGHVMYWKAEHAGGQHDLTMVGGMPVFRTQVWRLFLDLGIGADILSRTQIGTRHLSTAFQFHELVAVGAAFGAQKQYELALRAQHVSNAGIKEPNPGVTFATVDLRYRF